MYLFFDTETTGLPKNYNAPASDTENWPRLVQIAWSWYDAGFNKWDSYSFVIKPEGFIIPDEVAKIHRVSQERALLEGRDLQEIMAFFAQEVKKADFVIGHNIDFDDKIVSSEYFRLKLDNPMVSANKVCTMKGSVNYCRIPNNRGSYKWPNLSELYFVLFGEQFADAHDALVDVNACAKCFFELKNKGAI